MLVNTEQFLQLREISVNNVDGFAVFVFVVRRLVTVSISTFVPF